MNVKPGYVVVALLILAVAVGLGWVVGSALTKQACQAAAINAGHAQYRVVDEFGKVNFEWLPNHGNEKPMVSPASQPSK